MKRKLSLIFAVLMLMQFCVKAQTVVESPAEDSSLIFTPSAESNEENYVTEDTAGRSFAKDVLGDTGITFRSLPLSYDTVSLWKNKKEYNWIKNLDSILKAKPKPSEQSSGKYAPPSARQPIELGFFSYILWALAAGFVIFILVKLFMSGGAFKGGGKRVKEAADNDEDYVEDINEKDFQVLKKRAYASGDMRMATRYLFLFTLQQLQQRELIRFSPDKTNSMYLNELPAAKRGGFAQLSLYYEYIWYGKAPVEPQQFDAIEIKFNEFLNKG